MLDVTGASVSYVIGAGVLAVTGARVSDVSEVIGAGVVSAVVQSRATEDRRVFSE